LRLLLDTHALIWWTRLDRRLGHRAARAIGDESNEVFVSAISALEVATKHRLGKLPEGERWAADFQTEMDAEGFVGLPVSVSHARLAGGLAIPRGDPFDRVLIAQSILEAMVLVSNEALFDAFGVTRLW
jgi:PIN domain nuclease of toxin-antitoxin system